MKYLCEAQFKGWIPQPGEIEVKLETPQIIQIHRLKFEHWHARIKGYGDLPYIDGPYLTVQMQVRERFREMLTDWTWVNGEGLHIDPPDSTTRHHRAVSPPGTKLNISLCGKLADFAWRLKGEVDCPECLKLYNPPAVEPVKAKKIHHGRIVHARSGQGCQVGSVETLCGKTVLHRRTVSYGMAYKNQGPKITCDECARLVDELVAEHERHCATGGIHAV